MKHEQAREEKRRQEILSKRRQEQNNATEKYQRANSGSARSRSPTHHNNFSSHIPLEEALRLVRGDSMDENTRNTLQRMHSHHQNGRDPLEKSGSSRQSHKHGEGRGASAGHHHHNHHRSHHHQGTSSNGRPLSGQVLDASMRAELMERSQRNMISSRNRFEQQLEQHQQLLVEQQQKSLREFNQAIRREIDSDTKVGFLFSVCMSNKKKKN